jgi:hypothetical protein
VAIASVWHTAAVKASFAGGDSRYFQSDCRESEALAEPVAEAAKLQRFFF